jgi:hypothetical protein
MPTRIQTLTRQIKEAKGNTNIYAALQAQIDLIVEYLKRTA